MESRIDMVLSENHSMMLFWIRWRPWVFSESLFFFLWIITITNLPTIQTYPNYLSMDWRKIANADMLFPCMFIISSPGSHFLRSQVGLNLLGMNMTKYESRHHSAEPNCRSQPERRSMSKWNQTLTIVLRVVRMLLNFFQTDSIYPPVDYITTNSWLT